MAATKGRVLVDVVEAGRKGGEARRDNMTPSERRLSAQGAVNARWEKYYAANPDKLKAKQERESRKKKRRK
jgi:hypothetical protein